MLPNFVVWSQNDGNFPKFIQSRASSLKSSVNSDWDVATSPFLDSSLHAFKTPKFWKKKNSPIFLRKSRAFSSVQSTRNEHVRNVIKALAPSIASFGLHYAALQAFGSGSWWCGSMTTYRSLVDSWQSWRLMAAARPAAASWTSRKEPSTCETASALPWRSCAASRNWSDHRRACRCPDEWMSSPSWPLGSKESAEKDTFYSSFVFKNKF